MENILTPKHLQGRRLNDASYFSLLESNPDAIHLLSFHDDEHAYATLLNAVIQTVRDREILNPILPEDVFMRHPSLGGTFPVHCGWAYVEEPTSPEEIIETISTPFLATPEQRYFLRCLKRFFDHAVACGDMSFTNLMTRTGDLMQGYDLACGRAQNPSVGRSVFYQEPKTKQVSKDKRSAQRAMQKRFRPKTGARHEGGRRIP